ncbi:DUF4168 domain-containing protein [Pontibacter sp. CAU 1760]
MKKGSIVAAVVVASMCFGPAAFSQTTTAQGNATQEQNDSPFSQEELKSFVAANTKATKIQKESRESLIAAIEAEELTVDRFNEMAKAHREKKLKEVAENPEEIAAFSNAAQAIVKLQPETKEKIKQAIEGEGLTMEKYDTIMKAYEQDEDLQVEIRRIVHAAQ